MLRNKFVQQRNIDLYFVFRIINLSLEPIFFVRSLELFIRLFLISPYDVFILWLLVGFILCVLSCDTYVGSITSILHRCFLDVLDSILYRCLGIFIKLLIGLRFELSYKLFQRNEIIEVFYIDGHIFKKKKHYLLSRNQVIYSYRFTGIISDHFGSFMTIFLLDFFIFGTSGSVLVSVLVSVPSSTFAFLTYCLLGFVSFSFLSSIFFSTFSSTFSSTFAFLTYYLLGFVSGLVTSISVSVSVFDFIPCFGLASILTSLTSLTSLISLTFLTFFGSGSVSVSVSGSFSPPILFLYYVLDKPSSL